MKKKLIPSIILLIGGFWLTSCNSSQNNAANQGLQPNASPASPTSTTEQAQTDPSPTATITPTPLPTTGINKPMLPTPTGIPVTPVNPSLGQPTTGDISINLDPSLTGGINTPSSTETSKKTATRSNIKTATTNKPSTSTSITTEYPTKSTLDTLTTAETSRKTATSSATRNPARPEVETPKTPKKTTTRTAVATGSVRRTTSGQQPQAGTVKRMVSGDLMCYVTVVDEKGKEQEVGADFDICTQQSTFLNQKVRLSYQTVSVNDCQSAEPCGKTRKQSLITKMELVGEKLATTANRNFQTITNGKLTITIGNLDSWSGVNGTGDLTYRGCDAKGKCIDLRGGTVACRDGICSTGWTNGDFSYILQQPITEGGSTSPTTLEIRKGGDVIQTARGFKVVSSQN
ncbi:MAG: hypothetical protein VKL59_18915 [Nostocaceae cyanobacterium]|nr:hypothetical protein [Nostocaceae cyanobacterium]